TSCPGAGTSATRESCTKRRKSPPFSPPRLFYRRQDHGPVALLAQWPDEPVSDFSVTLDYKRFGNAIDAEVDRGPPVTVGTNPFIRIAILVEEAFGIRGVVLIGEPEQTHPKTCKLGIRRKLQKQFMLLVAGHAPGGKDIDESHLALAEVRIRKSWLAIEPFDRRQGKFRNVFADKCRRQERRIAGIEPDEKQRGQGGENNQRYKNEKRSARRFGLGFLLFRGGAHFIPNLPRMPLAGPRSGG